jgi:hypothetical protein
MMGLNPKYSVKLVSNFIMMKSTTLIIVNAFAFIILTTSSFLILRNLDTPEDKVSCQTMDRYETKVEKTERDFEFLYHVESRFLYKISKEKVDKALTIGDVLPDVTQVGFVTYSNVKVTKFAEERSDWIIVDGGDEVFSPEQIQLLRSMDFTSSFSITGSVSTFDVLTGLTKRDTIVQYMTIVPDLEATYKPGYNALIKHVKDKAKEFVSFVEQDKLSAGKVSFVITKEGNIDQVELSSSCNYPLIDSEMLTAVSEMPGSWEAARNKSGEKVDQELVLFFGLMGC